MAFSQIKFTYAGVNEFDLNFALGYSARSDVDCYVDKEDFPADVQFDWLSDNRVRIVPTNVNVGDVITFSRTVSKTSLPINLKAPSSLTRENVERAILHTLYAAHEVFDGRAAVPDTSGLVFDAVNNAVESALSNFIFHASFKKDVLVEPDATLANAVATYTSGNATCKPEDVVVFVKSAPAVDTEILINNGGTTQFSVTIGSNGLELNRSNTEVVFEEGAITSTVAGGNYVSGLEVVLVFPTIHTVLVDFDATVPAFVETYTTARDT